MYDDTRPKLRTARICGANLWSAAARRRFNITDCVSQRRKLLIYESRNTQATNLDDATAVVFITATEPSNSGQPTQTPASCLVTLSSAIDFPTVSNIDHENQ